MAKVQQGYLPDKKTGIQRFMPTDPQDAYELREARSEIARHHRLITDMREALEWALPITKMFGQGNRLSEVVKRHDQYRKLLNRQVS